MIAWEVGGGANHHKYVSIDVGGVYTEWCLVSCFNETGCSGWVGGGDKCVDCSMYENCIHFLEAVYPSFYIG